jgi:hypothetical protein
MGYNSPRQRTLGVGIHRRRRSRVGAVGSAGNGLLFFSAVEGLEGGCISKAVVTSEGARSR